MLVICGEPALYPDIVEIVRFIADNKMKPVMLSNGMELTKDLLKELKKAKLASLVFYIDMW